MHVIFYPTYTDFFDAPKPLLTDLIHDLPNSFIVTFVSLNNSELYFTDNIQLSQFRLFSMLIERQYPDEKERLLSKFTDVSNKYSGDFQIFTSQNALELLHKSLIRAAIVEEIEDTTPSQEIALLKALLIVSEGLDENYQVTEDRKNIYVNYRKAIWPYILNQFELTNNVNYLVEMVLAKKVLDHFQSDPDYSKYVNTFLQRNNSENSFTYLFTLTKLIQNVQEQRSKEAIVPFYINITDNLNFMFENLCLDFENYKNDYSDAKKHYSGIKINPLYKEENNRYLIIDFELFAKRLYTGLFFDFYKNSGIDEVPRFSKFINFKNYIGEHCTEKYTLKLLLNAIFPKKHIVRCFDGNKEGYPDAYIRSGKKIFLFEIKDSFFPSEVVDSSEYNKIINEIDKKYNTEKKGIGQLISQIKKQDITLFENNTMTQLNLKTTGIQIYPILVYTDNFLNLPGIAVYLRDEFNKKLTSEIRCDYKKVHDLTFVNIRFFIENIDLLSQKEYRFDKIIENWNLKIDARMKKVEKDISQNLQILHNANVSFETLFYQSHSIDPKRKNYIETLFDKLDLKKGLSD